VYREQSPPGLDRVKFRKLETGDDRHPVAYSSMSSGCIGRLERALEQMANPLELSRLNTAEFAEGMGKLYAELDYIHPFDDGNSRTLREFTRQLAGESGTEICWERFGRDKAGRDLLYIARDKSVNEIAVLHVEGESTRRAIGMSIAWRRGSRDMPDLLRDIIRPHRAPRWSDRLFLGHGHKRAVKGSNLRNGHREGLIAVCRVQNGP